MAIECVTSILVILGSTPSLLLRQWIFYTTNFHTKNNVAMFSVTSKLFLAYLNLLKQLPQFYKIFKKSATIWVTSKLLLPINVNHPINFRHY